MNYRKLVAILLVILCAMTPVVVADTYTWIGTDATAVWDLSSNWLCKGACFCGVGDCGYPDSPTDNATVYVADTLEIEIITVTIEALLIEHTGTYHSMWFRPQDAEGNTLTCDSITIVGPASGSYALYVAVDEDATLTTVNP